MSITFDRKCTPITIFKDGEEVGIIRRTVTRHWFRLHINGVYWHQRRPTRKGGSLDLWTHTVKEAKSIAEKILTGEMEISE